VNGRIPEEEEEEGLWPKDQSIRFWRRFGSYPDLNPEFLDPDRDRNPGIFKGFFIYYS